MVPLRENENGWGEYRKMVLKELENLGRVQEDIRKDITLIREEIASLKVKSGVWGLVGGMIPVAIAIIYSLVQKG
jgi:hypothetical protein